MSIGDTVKVWKRNWITTYCGSKVHLTVLVNSLILLKLRRLVRDKLPKSQVSNPSLSPGRMNAHLNTPVLTKCMACKGTDSYGPSTTLCPQLIFQALSATLLWGGSSLLCAWHPRSHGLFHLTTGLCVLEGHQMAGFLLKLISLPTVLSKSHISGKKINCDNTI